MLRFGETVPLSCLAIPCFDYKETNGTKRWNSISAALPLCPNSERALSTSAFKSTAPFWLVAAASLLFSFFFWFFSHPCIHPSSSSCPFATQASQHALTTGSFNAAAICSPLMSSAGGGSPSSLEQWVRVRERDGWREREWGRENWKYVLSQTAAAYWWNWANITS